MMMCFAIDFYTFLGEVKVARACVFEISCAQFSIGSTRDEREEENRYGDTCLADVHMNKCKSLYSKRLIRCEAAGQTSLTI